MSRALLLTALIVGSLEVLAGVKRLSCLSVISGKMTPQIEVVESETDDFDSSAGASDIQEGSPYTADFFPDQKLSVHGNQDFSLEDIQHLRENVVQRLKDYIVQDSNEDEATLEEIRKATLTGSAYIEAALKIVKGLRNADLSQFPIVEIPTPGGTVPGFQLKVQFPKSSFLGSYTVPVSWNYYLPWVEGQGLDPSNWSQIEEGVLNQVTTTMYQLESDQRVFEVLESVRGISYHSSNQAVWKMKLLMKIMIQNSEDYINGASKGFLFEILQQKPKLLGVLPRAGYSGRERQPLAYRQDVERMSESGALKILTKILQSGTLYRRIGGYKFVSRRFTLNLYFDRNGILQSLSEGWGSAPTDRNK